MESKEIKRYARRYDREFKENAVALVESGRSMREVAQELGASYGSLKYWVQQGRKGQEQKELGSIKALSSEGKEIQRLKQRCAYLEVQRDILKKALGIVSQEVPKGGLK